MVTRSSSEPIIRRMVPMEAVGPVELGLVAVTSAPCIIRSVGGKGYGIHPPIILIQIPSNTLARF